MQWINTSEHGFLLHNNQNLQQNKVIDMVNGNDLIKHNYWPNLYLSHGF